MWPWKKLESKDKLKSSKWLSGSIESLSEEELTAVYGAGARIHSSHHRPPPSALSSTCSSSTSVATNGSTVALLHSSQRKKSKNKYNVHKYNLYNKGIKMTSGAQKELNLLLTAPTVPEIIKSESEKDPKKDEANDGRLPNSHEATFETLNSSGIIIKEKQDSSQSASIIPQVLASLSVSLGSLAVGFSSAYTSPALPSMTDATSILYGKVSAEEMSWIGSIMPLAALFGGMAGGPLIESLGRRTTIISTAVPFIVSFLLIALAVNVAMVMTGRAIAGFCVGIASLALPVYLGETVLPEVRGMLGLLPTTLGNIGILLCYVAGAYLDWSMLAFAGALIPVPFLICMFFIPETPRWYIGRNKHKKARKALQWLRGQNADISAEFDEIEKTNAESNKNEKTAGCSELFAKMYRRPLLISIGLMFFQQMSGINAVIFYTVKIFKEAGSTIDGNICTIIVGIVNFGSTFVATMLIDRLGRKVLLYISSIAMIATLGVLGLFFWAKERNIDVTAYGWIPLASFVIYVIGFSIGFGPIPWLMMGEILPAKIRGPAASLATSFNWSCTFIVTKTFVDLLALIGSSGTFWLFTGICAVGLVFVVLFVPETQGKSLEDIERNLTGGPKVPVRQCRRMSSIANLKPLPMAV
ncbi:trehalose transporter 1-like protein isoform X3 [Bemisia tabaci]|uniref:trehalose transporter 1-like protein isoform X3 n=1 Tax=Bemisia tabaci TaxID=7038 RepID=UPI003B27D7D9